MNMNLEGSAPMSGESYDNYGSYYDLYDYDEDDDDTLDMEDEYDTYDCKLEPRVLYSPSIKLQFPTRQTCETERLLKDVIASELFDTIFFGTKRAGIGSVDELMFLKEEENVSMPIVHFDYDLILKKGKYDPKSYKMDVPKSCPRKSRSDSIHDTMRADLLTGLKEMKNPVYFILIDPFDESVLVEFSKLVRLVHKKARIMAMAMYPTFGEEKKYNFRIGNFMLFDPVPGEKNYNVFEGSEVSVGGKRETSIRKVNFWSIRSGFIIPVKFQSRSKNDFKGRSFSIRVELHPTTIWFAGEDLIKKVNEYTFYRNNAKVKDVEVVYYCFEKFDGPVFLRLSIIE